MTTLLYGEQPGADVAPGNRADAEVDPGASGTHPRLLPTVEIRAVAPGSFSESPSSPEPQPWLRPRSSFPALFLGLATVAAMFAGLALWGIALAWSQSLSRLTELGLMAAGGYLIAIGIACIMYVQQSRDS